MELKLANTDRQRIIDILYELKRECEPSSSLGVIYENLKGFAEKHSVRLIETKDLAKLRKASGAYYPYLNVIYIQSGNITKMAPTLAHEIGHVIAFKAGIGDIDLKEELADILGDTIMDLLTL